MSKLKTALLSIGGVVVGIVTLRAFRKRRSGTDEEEGDADPFEKEEEAESPEVGDEKEVDVDPSEEKDEAESLEEEDETEPSEEGDDTPETAAEHAEVAAEHALLAVEKSLKDRMEA